MKLDIAKDGSIRLPAELLQALGAEPGDTLKFVIDRRRKTVRFERVSEDAWADAMREGPSKKLDDILADQQKRQADAEDLFDKKLKEPEPDDEKLKDDPDKWR